MKTHFEKPRLFKNVVLTVLAAVFALSAVQLNSYLTGLKVSNVNHAGDSIHSASFRWHPLLFRILAFGQEATAVDILLLRFLTDDVITKIKDGEETEVFRVLNLATDIDPAFHSLYTSGASFLSIVRDDRHGALKLLLKGENFLETKLDTYPETFKATHWPLRWRINFTLGFLYLFDFDDFPKAIESYEKMGRYPDLAEGLAGKVERIRTVDGQAKLALGSIEVLKGWNKDEPRVLAELELRKRRVLENQRLGNWNRLFADELKRRPKGEGLETFFSTFKDKHQIPEMDSLGGRIFLRPDGAIDSTTKKIITLDIQSVSGIEKPPTGK